MAQHVLSVGGELVPVDDAKRLRDQIAGRPDEAESNGAKKWRMCRPQVQVEVLARGFGSYQAAQGGAERGETP